MESVAAALAGFLGGGVCSSNQIYVDEFCLYIIMHGNFSHKKSCSLLRMTAFLFNQAMQWNSLLFCFSKSNALVREEFMGAVYTRIGFILVAEFLES